MLKHIWIGLFVLSAAASFVGCENTDPPDAGNDTGDVDDTGTDTDVGDDVTDGSLALAATCAHSHQCASGLCVVLGQGVNDSLCSQRCDTASNCGDPGVWDCAEVDSSANDSVSVCVPKGLCLDNDGDGYGIGPGCLGPDCDDEDADVYFGAPELCDGKDNDCNGVIDDHTVIEDAPCGTGHVGVCAVGASSCVDGSAVCRTIINPGDLPEECDGLDNDCDGLVDESPAEDENGIYVVGTGQACSSTGDAQCENGITMCDPAVGIRCHVSSSFVDDTCDGIDNDCNGLIDDAVVGLNQPCIVGEGQCAAQGITVCDASPSAPPICDASPDDAASTTEICDYLDNDCDGVVDNTFVNADGVYFLTEHCGACGADCNARWATSEHAHTVTPICDTTTHSGLSNPATCSYTCAANRIDLDGDSNNGCEFLPNPQALYVAPANKGGTNDAFCGEYERPCRDIAKAIEMADLYAGTASERNVIIVAEGIYREGVIIPNGISLQGGYNALNWQRSVEVHRTIIIGSVSNSVIGSDQRVTVLADGITSPTELSGFTIIGEDGLNGANSIALLVRSSSNNLVVRDNVLRAGLGGQGVSGTNGSDGTSGAAGIQGAAGTNFNSSTCGSSNERAGGNGGASTCANPGGVGSAFVNGGAGATAACPSYGGSNPAPAAGMGSARGAAGSSAAGRGLYGTACYPHPDMVNESFPSNGALGGIGDDGSGGQGAQSGAGLLDATGMWHALPGQAGDHGGHGSGGGGGGASHGTLSCTGIDGDDRVFQNCEVIRLIGSGGGGGGGGGCAGSAATGGDGGGASIALYVHATGAAQVPVIEDNFIERNAGGQGGDGGIAGRGGDGGNGGIGGPAPATQTYCPQAGRSGGIGGRGGHGGGGGAGAGGISFDIAVFGTSINASTLEANNEFSLDGAVNTGGNGGPGGGSMGSAGTSGAAGLSGRIYNP